MAQELAAETPPARVDLLGVNAVGEESGNASITDGRSIPWLQDASSENVWTSWDVTYRDVVILGGANRRNTVYNLTEHDLSDPASYAELKALLHAAAAALP